LNEATENGALLIDHAVASEIQLKPGGDEVNGISYIRYDPTSGTKTPGLLQAKVFVIAANGIETPRLLLMSVKQRPGGVANSSDMVGRNLMDHPQYLTWGLLPRSQPAFPYRGPLVTSAIGELCDGPFRAHRAAFRVSLGNEGWSAVVGGTGGDPNVTTLDFVNAMNASGLNNKEFSQLADNNSALLGTDLANFLGNLISRQFRIAFPIEQNPDANNRVTLSRAVDGLGLPRPKINYDISEYTMHGFAAAYQLKNLIFSQLGATDFTKPSESDPTAFKINGLPDEREGRFAYGGAGHVMGTYRMGEDPKTSVVDKWQCSHDHPNLYLVGSGTFPTVGTANPTLTLSALALRTAEHIIDNLTSVKA
jgi:choline dehydrogenase-like flavoprotein